MLRKTRVGYLSVKRTVVSLTTSVLSSAAIFVAVGIVFHSSKCAFTSAAVSFRPEWNFTSSRREKRTVAASTNRRMGALQAASGSVPLADQGQGRTVDAAAVPLGLGVVEPHDLDPVVDEPPGGAVAVVDREQDL